MVKKSLFLVIGLFTFCLFASENSIESRLKNIVNTAFVKQNSIDSVVALATNNKMLSQKMAKCAVLIKNSIYVEKNHKVLLESAEKFDAFIHGMYHGDSLLNLKKETDTQVLDELSEVNEEWINFYTHVKNLYKEDKVDMLSYQYIIEHNEKLLKISHKLTQTIQSKTMFNTSDNQVLVNTLKFADRQKMLTQKMLKEKFLVYTNENKKRNNVKLRGSIILFRNGLNGLIQGDKKRGIAPVSNKAILQKLQDILTLYNASEALYIKQNVDMTKMKILTRVDNRLLQLSTEVFSMIQNTLVY
jgi:hypothetical protein